MNKIISILFLTLIVGCGVDGLVQEAKIKKDSGKTLDALELYNRAIQQESRSISALVGRANIYSDLGRYTEAASDFISAAIYSDDKIKKGEYYYLGAFNYLVGPASCSVIKDSINKHFQTACDLGKKEACGKTCP